jgi:hypothetical protein
MRMLGGEKEGVTTRTRAFRWRTAGQGGSKGKRAALCKVPTTISPTSMILARAFAIGLSDYSRPVMLARAIVLLHPHRGPGFHIARPLVRAPWFGEPRGGERAASPAHPH